jgi:tetratricopeptide (TPR) repeat protein
MAHEPYRVFLSAVSGELGAARRAIAADLRARGLSVREQEDFTQNPDTTLRKLHDYVHGCHAVICIIGRRDGAMPSAYAAAPFRSMGILPAGFTEASYTQWELFFARYFHRHLLRFIADDGFYAPDEPPPWDALQRAFVDHIIVERSEDRGHFASLDALRADVRGQCWPDMLSGKLIDLRYPTLGPLFKGRDVFLRRLRESLEQGRGQAAIVGRAVHGLGGVGKTRAAVEYAWAGLGDYAALLFVEAPTPETLRANIAALCDKLVPEATATEQKVRFEAALGWLNAHPGWMLILDNIDDRKALEAVQRVIAQLQGGQVLLTGRYAALPAAIPAFEMGVLAPEDAVSFLLESTAGRRREAPDDAAEARALAEELGGLALALELAGAVILRRGLGFSAYRALWRENRNKVPGWSDQPVTEYPRVVAETWQTSVAQLSPAGRALLERLASLAPDPVPLALLDVAVPGAGAEDSAAALDDLVAYSLAARMTIATRYGEQTGFSVHRLVQDVTRRSLDAEAARARLTAALGWVNAAFTGDPQDVRNWPRLDPLAPHARAVVAFADAAGIAEPTARLMHEVASLLDAKALLAEAEPLKRRVVAILEKSLGTDHANVATALNNLATLLHTTNRRAEAEPLMRRALAIAEARFETEYPNVVAYLNNLAQLLQDTNRLAEAEPLMHRALAIAEAGFGADHPVVAICLNNLARLLLATNRLAEAEPLMRRALAIDEARFGADHPNVAIRLNNLAALLQYTNRLAEAEPLMRRALAIDEARFEADHPAVATDLNNLAGLLRATNRLSEAEKLSRRHLAIFFAFEKQTGYPHPHRDAAIGNYAGLLQAMGRSEAEIRAAIAEIRREASGGTATK